MVNGKSKEKNIILLSMSTLPMKEYLKENQYQFNGEPFCGVSQLEPGTQYYIHTLLQGNRTLDRIYLVSSQKTRDPLAKDVVEYILGEKFLAEDEVMQEMSTVDFFKARIRRYISEVLLECQPKPEENFGDDLFRVIPLEDANEGGREKPLYTSINKLCGEIREEKSETEMVNLF